MMMKINNDNNNDDDNDDDDNDDDDNDDGDDEGWECCKTHLLHRALVPICAAITRAHLHNIDEDGDADDDNGDDNGKDDPDDDPDDDADDNDRSDNIETGSRSNTGTRGFALCIHPGNFNLH